MLERLRCGVITTALFREWLAEWYSETGGTNFGLVPQLDYVRFASGDRAGEEYISILWQPPGRIQAHEIFEIGGVRVYLPKATRTALRERCLDVRNGSVIVR